MFGHVNRTVEHLPANMPAEYCDADADLQAALDYVTERSMAEQVVLWRSSYSAALVFRAAAENADRVAGVLAFSPASGGPLVECRARMWLGDVRAPLMVLRPESEMARETSLEQRQILIAASARFRVVENGVHGSSMLVDARTNHDMSADRSAVADWLAEVLAD